MVKLVSYSKDYMQEILSAMSLCYGADPSKEALEKVIQAGHLSLIEHCYASFEIECSLKVLMQITRHRLFSFTVKSSRGSKMEGFILPAEIEEYSDDIDNMFDLYDEAIKIGVEKQFASYLLLTATTTKLKMTGNLRMWYEFLPKRLCKRAMPEIREIAERIHTDLTLAIPEVFNRNFLNCEQCKESGCKF